MTKWDVYTLLILFGAFAFVYADKWYTRWINQRNGW